MANLRGTVLLVDGDTEFSAAVAAFLRELGLTVEVAANADEAKHIWGTHQIDTNLVCDELQGMSGMALLRKVREQTSDAFPPSILYSANFSRAKLQQALQFGIDYFIQKPFGKKEIVSYLTRCIENHRLRSTNTQQMERLKVSAKRIDELLYTIYPGPVAEELKQLGEVRPRRVKNVAVMFTDLAGFTSFCEVNEPETVVAHLQRVTKAFEKICEAEGVQKIKTIGDAFLATGGLTSRLDNPVLSCVRCGLQMIDAVKENVPDWSLRVGISFGPVVAGIVGRRQALYDIWGSTVNTAQRIESNGASNRVSVGEFALAQIDKQCDVSETARLYAKGLANELIIYQVDKLHEKIGAGLFN